VALSSAGFFGDGVGRMVAMDDIPNDILRKAYERKPAYLLKVPMHFALWAVCTWILYKTQDSPYAIIIGIACSLFIANLIRGLGAVAHDAVHGNLSKSKLVSYLIALLCWSPTGMSVTIYSNYHLHHHKIANTYPDVDNVVVTDWTTNPFLAKALLFVIYLIAYPLYFLFAMFRYTKRLSFALKVRMNVEVVGIFTLIYLAHRAMPGQVFFFFLGLPFIVGAFLASFTSMIEHLQMEPGEDAYSSRTYGTKAHLINFIWNNVSYHNEHHKFPGIPFYNLRSFHEAAYPYYDDRVKAECHESVFALGFRLYGRVLSMDVPKLAAKYESLNKKAEKDRSMEMPGIQPGAA
jgi:fatty acid desaturase